MSEKPDMKVAGVIPYMRVSNANEAADYYKTAFAATEIDRMPTPDGRLMHCHLEINGGAFMFSDAFPEHGMDLQPVQGVVLHIASFAPKVWWQRAVDAGLDIVVPLKVEFWGDYYGQLRDRYGITWGIVGPVEAQ